MQTRKKLVAKLIDSARRHAVTVVVAPIGYGKSAVALELAETLGEAVRIVDDYRPGESPEPDAAAEAGESRSNLIVFARTLPGAQALDPAGKDVAVFTSEALSFSDDETREYLHSLGIRDDGAAGLIAAVGEGWPAVVRLSAKSWLETGDAGVPPEMEAVLVKSLLADYSDSERAFLARLAVMDSFTMDDARALAGEDGAAWFGSVYDLHSLAFRDDMTGKFRLRRIISSFLEKELTGVPDPDLTALYRQAARQSVGNGDLIGAFRLYFRAGKVADILEALALFLKPGADRMCADHAEEILAAVHSVPLALRQRQILGYLAFIRLFLSTRSDTHLAEWRLTEIEAGLARAKKIPPEEIRRLKGEIAVIKGILACDDTIALWEKFSEARKLLQGPSRIHPDRLMWHNGCPHLSSACLHTPGDYEWLVKRATSTGETLRVLTDDHCGDCAAVLMVEYHLERGKYRLARNLLERLDQGQKRIEGAATLLPLALARARLFVLDGNAAAAVAVVRALRRRVADSGDRTMAESVDLVSGYLGTVLGNDDLVPDWLKTGVTLAPPHSASWKLSAFFAVYGKTLIAASDFSRLRIVAKTIQERLRLNGSLIGGIHAMVLEAISLRHLQGTKKAQEPLFAALEASRADELALPIAEYGGLVVPILRAMKKECGGDRHFKQVLSLAEKCRELGIGREAAQDNLLSFREQEKMRMVVKGLSNEAIGRELGITANAVRKSLIQVYAKLGASNRTQATHLFTVQNR